MSRKKLGDVVESIIGAVVPEKIVESVKKKGCGCKKNKEALNRADDRVSKFLNLND